jgi:RNA polymerase sigma factor (sigma-70 family)
LLKKYFYNFIPLAFIKKISSSFSDSELVVQYKQTESMETLGDLYSRYMDLLYGVCLKYFKNPDEAQDAVIHIFEELVTKVKKYEIENFKGWLYQLAKNHCLMKLMHLTENMHLDAVMEKESNLIVMEHCIEQLPEEQKKSIQLFYLQEKCYKEIAETTALDINKVRSFIQNGRRNLKICMDKTALQKAE